jgi:hypothetical protein
MPPRADRRRGNARSIKARDVGSAPVRAAPLDGRGARAVARRR